MSGGNCNQVHRRYTREQYAYDFVTSLDPIRTMPIGTRIVAARDGQVIFVEERFADGTFTSRFFRDVPAAAFRAHEDAIVFLPLGDQIVASTALAVKVGPNISNISQDATFNRTTSWSQVPA